MRLTYLAHGGQMTGDEMAIMGGGLLFALLFPVALLFIVAKTRKAPKADRDGTGHSGSESAGGICAPGCGLDDGELFLMPAVQPGGDSNFLREDS